MNMWLYSVLLNASKMDSDSNLGPTEKGVLEEKQKIKGFKIALVLSQEVSTQYTLSPQEIKLQEVSLIVSFILSINSVKSSCGIVIYDVPESMMAILTEFL